MWYVLNTVTTSRGIKRAFIAYSAIGCVNLLLYYIAGNDHIHSWTSPINIVGFLLLAWASTQVAMLKGYHWLVGLIGVFFPIGFVVLWSLRGRTAPTPGEPRLERDTANKAGGSPI